MKASKYDLIVIGSGPAGQKGAIAAAKLGKSVAIIDRTDMLGGVSLHTGTIPSKTFREAVMHLTGFRQRAFYGKDYSLKEKLDRNDFRIRVQAVLEREIHTVRAQLVRNNVELLNGLARFLDAHTIEFDSPNGKIIAKGEKILVACGTRPAHNPSVPVDGKRVFDVNQLAQMEGKLKEIIVVGAGVIGLEFACMLAAVNINVTVIEQRDTILDFVDKEITEALMYHMRKLGVVFRLGEKVISVEKDERDRVVTHMESRKKIHGNSLLYAVGRQANTDSLSLEAVEITPDKRGRLVVNEFFQTSIPHIYAAGDVIGFPALAATSMEQGRLASCHMFGVPAKHLSELLPYGIYTIPEISMVGKTEQELTHAKIPYEFGIAQYEELARGQIIGDQTGILKILFDPESLRLLGVHIIGEGATELIHIGQTVMSFDGTIEYLRDTVFNYPTLAEAYKVAALNGFNKI